MPINLLPIAITVLLVGIPFLCAFRGFKAFILSLATSVTLIFLIVIPFYCDGMKLQRLAQAGNVRAQYELARWYEGHCSAINQWVIWPCRPDVQSGYEHLEKAASQDLPIALYTLGVRLQHGIHIPLSAGPSKGKRYWEVIRGLELMDRAIDLGFQPPNMSEWEFYLSIYRGKYIRKVPTAYDMTESIAR